MIDIMICCAVWFINSNLYDKSKLGNPGISVVFLGIKTLEINPGEETLVTQQSLVVIILFRP